MKKTIKKLTAIIVAAATAASISFTVAADSTNAVCVPHTTYQYYDGLTQSRTTHKHLYEIRLDENGKATNIYKDCTITTNIYHWKYVCSKCGTVTKTEDEVQTVHRECIL